jgi:flagella basal body P-ring formation protein FlgA
LQSARMGQLVKVRNLQSRKIVEGIVSGEGQVKVNL